MSFSRGFAHLLVLLFAVIAIIAGFFLFKTYKNQQAPTNRLEISQPNEEKTNAPSSQTKKVIGFLVYWDKIRGLKSIQDNKDIFTEVSPWAYTITGGADIIIDPKGGASIVDDNTIAYLKGLKKPVIPTIHNLIDGIWNGQLVHDLIADSSSSNKLVDNIVSLVISKGYDGIDINFENLMAEDRDTFSAFIAKLAGKLHGKDKLLAVDVYGKTYEPGFWSGPQAHDYKALGVSVDELRIFAYDYSPSTIGPITPYTWLEQVVAFAVTQVPREKLIIGIPLYGYEWNNKNTEDKKTLTWIDATNIASTNNASIKWDKSENAPNFSYDDKTVWFENSESTGRKLNLVNTYNIGGIQLWRLGGEDPQTYKVLKTKYLD